MSQISVGRELRDQNLARIEQGRHQDWVAAARAKAVEIAKAKGRVSINDLRKEIELPPDAHPNTWGAVMKTPELRASGQYESATHAAAHARVVRIFVPS